MIYTDVADREAQHVMVFGDNGSGKSTLVSKLALLGYNLIWLSADQGHKVLRKLPREAQERINLVRLPDTKDYPIAQETVRKLFRLEAHDVCHDHGRCECSCIGKGGGFDHLDFNQLKLDTIVVVDHATAVASSFFSAITIKQKADDYQPQLSDYMSWGFHLSAWLKNVQVAPFHCIVIAQTVEAVQDDKSSKLNPDIGSSKYCPNVGQYFDHIVFCKVMNLSHKFGSSTTYDTSVITKSRDDVVIEKMEVPSLLPFFGPPSEVSIQPKFARMEMESIKGTVAGKGSTAATVAAAEPALPQLSKEDIRAKIDAINAAKKGAGA